MLQTRFKNVANRELLLIYQYVWNVRVFGRLGREFLPGRGRAERGRKGAWVLRKMPGRRLPGWRQKKPCGGWRGGFSRAVILRRFTECAVLLPTHRPVIPASAGQRSCRFLRSLPDHQRSNVRFLYVPIIIGSIPMDQIDGWIDLKRRIHPSDQDDPFRWMDDDRSIVIFFLSDESI